MRRCWATEPADRLKFPDILTRLKRLQHEQKFRPTAPVLPSTVLPPVTYSELCLHDEGTLQLDSDQYLVPKKHEPREYITVLSGDAVC
ncbi:hypothetical protein Pmani_014571 [Petrolisthes manimaculis]|uniref:Uncharacterized protein n=1 Tax=Petrolisthes manimaculis TaxID=1843537 RepID=A0AAE1PW69_9EUCA|nr:hypothetical protein Pmani_014571 [Petrolisthes manimaculis]